MHHHSYTFITTAGLDSNPRLVKELSVLKRNASVHVIAFNVHRHSSHDGIIVQQFSDFTIKMLSALRKPFLPWLFSSFAHEVARLLGLVFTKSLLIHSIAHDKRTVLLLAELLLHKRKYTSEMIICHNLGALYPGYVLSRITGARLAFDMEDYHPGELIEGNAEKEKKRRELILQKMLPHCAYVSFAADGFYELTKKYLIADVPNPVVIYNTFHSDEFIEPQPLTDEKIRFIWFSQTIGWGRGLELFLEAIIRLDYPYEITLIGRVNDAAFVKELRKCPHVLIYPPLQQAELHRQLSAYDIGLALELSTIDLNKNYALSNKLFAYLQAGLFVMATDTLGQKQFLQRFPMHHVLCKQTVEGMCEAIRIIAHALPQIREQRLTRYQAARCIAWEHEQYKLIQVWEKILE
ncbi:glycosyltransferase involved in cell wall biosynthesis [Thermoflavifilum aggregans]|uniref:Glycosyltransferase involved in cell wall biosynthesis n=1 Tax=Thermoflavifilum aggregans TaxID=454188 RepID=A0A2M9CRX5_9BACT|nr:hypothetical protein [Thermoflavifilum aggregans]PJJ74682.1 glycosyltransferase involved in cell wall biosynthesis [Thermoflavifilum aggregans]